MAGRAGGRSGVGAAGPAGTAVADAVSAAVGFAVAARARLGKLKVPTWLLVSAACHGRLLAPGWPSA
ncbi:hypothetical protein ACWEQ3_51490 [Streptomyces mirabilis]